MSIIDLSTAESLLTNFMESSQEEVLQLFSKFEGAQYDQHLGYVFVPGSRKDKVLLVAHADTVWPEERIAVTQKNGILQSRNHEIYFEKGERKFKGAGIGADDRAGCAAIYYLVNNVIGQDHSILITTDEEKGVLGALRMSLYADIREIIKTHHWALELDRRGNNNVVFYNNEPKEFIDFVTTVTGYTKCQGSWSDIGALCQELICSVNISIGYLKEHTPAECLVLPWWVRTLNIVGDLLKDEQPRWVLPGVSPKKWKPKVKKVTRKKVATELIKDIIAPNNKEDKKNGKNSGKKS